MKSTIDIILISDARSENMIKMTEAAIRSATPHNVIVVESNSKVNYSGALTIHPDERFNYNRYLNIGARSGQADYIFFGNNDILFEAGWDDAIVTAMEENRVQSASPYCPFTHGGHFKMKPHSGIVEGYDIYKLFCGWAFVWKRTLYDKIGGLNEFFTFWCSDNVVAEQLKEFEEKHILVTSSVVQHLNGGSRTLIQVNDDMYRRYTQEELTKFNKLYNQKIFLREEDFPKARLLRDQ